MLIALNVKRERDTMVKRYREFGRQAEDAVRSIKDKELRREAFRILFLQFMAGGDTKYDTHRRRGELRRIKNSRKGLAVARKRSTAGVKQSNHPGRRGGGVAVPAVQKLIDSGSFQKGRDAASIMRELVRKRIILTASQLRMVLLRLSRSGKLKRRVKMKGRKVTYLYAAK